MASSGIDRFKDMLRSTAAYDDAAAAHAKLDRLYSRAYGPDSDLASRHRAAARDMNRAADRLRNEWLDRHSL